jgi:hypothetical protein
MNKDLTGADNTVKKYYMLQQKRILAWLKEEMAAPTSKSTPAAALSSGSTPASARVLESTSAPAGNWILLFQSSLCCILYWRMPNSYFSSSFSY